MGTGRGAVRLARIVWDDEVGGSNPLAPTVREWRSGSASAFQADSRGFESRLPLYLG